MPKNGLTPYQVYLNLLRIRRRFRDLALDIEKLIDDLEEFENE